jgi:hypothetical protein
MKRLVCLVLILVCLPAWTQPRKAAAPGGGTWHFAVAGDSRNCGDVVVPAIAARARAQGVAFYWHLGDLRWLKNVDEDMVNRKDRPAPSLAQYQESAGWQDFIDNQIGAWGDTPVFLGIGNHETYAGHTREQFLATFGQWADEPAVRDLRLHDDPNDRSPHTYYHWIERGIDFIYLDNATGDQLSEAQMHWLAGALQRAAANPDVKGLLVGSHAALPHSAGRRHAMDEWPLALSTGTEVYKLLLDFKKSTGKPVTLVSSHQHMYIPNLYDTQYWRENGGVLPGTIVGTAGAHRYSLPPEAGRGSRTGVYGFLLGTADAAGNVTLEFQEIREADVPAAVKARYAPGFVHWCFTDNRDK